MIYSASNEVIDPKTGSFMTFTHQQRVHIYLHLIVGYPKLQRWLVEQHDLPKPTVSRTTVSNLMRLDLSCHEPNRVSGSTVSRHFGFLPKNAGTSISNLSVYIN